MGSSRRRRGTASRAPRRAPALPASVALPFPRVRLLPCANLALPRLRSRSLSSSLGPASLLPRLSFGFSRALRRGLDLAPRFRAASRLLSRRGGFSSRRRCRSTALRASSDAPFEYNARAGPARITVALRCVHRTALCTRGVVGPHLVDDRLLQIVTAQVFILKTKVSLWRFRLLDR